MNIYIIERIEEEYSNSSHSFQSIADCILSYKEKTFDLTLAELAKQSFCAQSTVLRYIKNLGFESYTIFKHEINSDDYSAKNNVLLSINLVEGNKHLDSFLHKLINDIHAHKEVYIIAAGFSEIAAYDFYLKTKTINYNFKYINEPDQLSPKLDANSSEAIYLFISNSGRTNKWVKLAQNLNTNNTYLITNRETSPLSSYVGNAISLNNTIETEYIFKEQPYFSLLSIKHLLQLVFIKLK